MTEVEAQRHLDRFFATYSGLFQGRFDVWKAAKLCGAIPAGRYGRVACRVQWPILLATSGRHTPRSWHGQN